MSAKGFAYLDRKKVERVRLAVDDIRTRSGGTHVHDMFLRTAGARLGSPKELIECGLHVGNCLSGHLPAKKLRWVGRQ